MFQTKKFLFLVVVGLLLIWRNLLNIQTIHKVYFDRYLRSENCTTTKVMTTLEDVIVLITVFAGFDDMFLNWWAFYSKLNLSMAVVMIAEDKQTYNKYKNIPGIEVWKSLCGNFTMAAEAFDYDTSLYKQLVSCRASHLMRTLEIHSKVIYSDIDTVWL